MGGARLERATSTV